MSKADTLRFSNASCQLSLPLAGAHRLLKRGITPRSERFLPACYGGVEIYRPTGGCLGELVPHAAQWAERNRRFLEQPPDDWYHLVKELRALAGKHGKKLD